MQMCKTNQSDTILQRQEMSIRKIHALRVVLNMSAKVVLCNKGTSDVSDSLLQMIRL